MTFSGRSPPLAAATDGSPLPAVATGGSHPLADATDGSPLLSAATDGSPLLAAATDGSPPPDVATGGSPPPDVATGGSPPPDVSFVSPLGSTYVKYQHPSGGTMVVHTQLRGGGTPYPLVLSYDGVTKIVVGYKRLAICGAVGVKLPGNTSAPVPRRGSSTSFPCGAVVTVRGNRGVGAVAVSNKGWIEFDAYEGAVPSFDVCIRPGWRVSFTDYRFPIVFPNDRVEGYDDDDVIGFDDFGDLEVRRMLKKNKELLRGKIRQMVEYPNEPWRRVFSMFPRY